MSNFPNHDNKENENKKRLTKRCREMEKGKNTRRPSWCECVKRDEEFPERNAGEYQSMQLA
jgi:hypothetical protein